ncbi:MAG: DUF1592 domain-containing protein [Verrucomicrobia bacterium]|nr:DUF1592 domain-containing protein [Verrucomicrobiota bacterium]
MLWKDRELALNHTRPPSDGTLLIPGVAGAGDDTTADELELALRPPTEDALRARFDASLSRFCRVFPDSFYVPERGLIFQKEDKESEGRLLSAGFHLMVGYYRDDAPLRDLILDHGQQLELDRLWEELDFITAAPARQYKDFIFFERAEPPRFMHGAEFDFARSEDQDATSPGKILRLSEAYLTKARRNGGSEAALQAIQSYFTNISAQIRRVESGRLAAEPSHLRSLLRFAERAYRRPLDRTEADELIGFYRGLRGADGLAHEEAIRETVVSVLMSPRFCFPTLGLRSSLGGLAEDGGRWGMGSAKAGVETGARSLSDYELASRLSFFLWSSLPDAALLGHAAKGDLHDPKTLVAQARRMLQDDRSRALAVEFGGNWLDFRGFEEHNGVDRGRFKSFDNELRAAMFEEPVRFFLSVVREDRSVLDLLYGDYTFVNPVLAKHYGAPIAVTNGAAWSRLDNAHQYGRGGLLPMSVFLTKNSPGLRTSPVKRGYWVVRRLLGEIIPPPPPTVPELPADESKLGELTLRDALARHRADKSCAGCHARFDCFGLLFEDYGPTGERRLLDLGGRPVDTKATFPGGGEGVSLDDLRRYIHGRREEEFLENLCRKLLSYGLGRSLILSDDSAVRSMRRKLAAEGNRFSALVESIVTSSQFLNQRARPDVTKN